MLIDGVTVLLHCIAITFHFFYFLLFFSILCVFMFYGLTPEIKMDWIGLDWMAKSLMILYAGILVNRSPRL